MCISDGRAEVSEVMKSEARYPLCSCNVFTSLPGAGTPANLMI